MHVLISGPPGVGKTTLVQRLADTLRQHRPVGFYTEEIREHGTRRGFRLVTLDGRELVLSHVERKGAFRVGRYGVDVSAFERLLEDLSLSRCGGWLVIVDEIGKMECLSRRFQEEILALLDSSRTVVATIAQRGGGFIQRVKRRPDVRIVTVTRENRDHLAETLSEEIQHARGTRG